MRYSVYIARKKYAYNCKKYLAITLQYALGICLIFIAFNMQLHAERELDGAKNNTANNLVRIVGDMTQADFQAAYAKVDIPDEVEVVYYRNRYIRASNNVESFNMHVYFVDELFYKYLVGNENIDANMVYAGKNALSILRGDNLYADAYSEKYLNINASTIFGIDISTIQELENPRYIMPPMEYEMMLDQSGIDAVAFDDSIFIPIERLTFSDDNSIASEVYISIDDESSTIVENYCLEICKALKNINPDMEYDYNYINGWTTGRFIEMQNNALYLRTISIVTFVIIFFGLTGILLLTINKRKRDMSISIVCGGGKGKVFIEIFSEMAYVIISGLLLGVVIGSVILQLRLIPGQVTDTYFLSYLICIAITIALNCIVCLTALFSIRSLSPLETIHQQ